MLIYDLVCNGQHKFEGWFQSIEDYQSQLGSGLLCCPVCESPEVRKIPSASYINTGVSRSPSTSMSADKEVASAQSIESFRAFIEANSDNVGGRFSEEARKIHYGEVKQRNIHGTASLSEITELHEEGVKVLPLPINFNEKKNLN